jgi:hypothetical protein
MPIILPGIGDFITGTSAAIQQQNGRLLNDNQVTTNFINSLNAFNTAQSTDDNLQLRRLFQESQQPTVLGRLDDAFAQANNPFTAQQALVASQQFAPLLAQRTLQNPFLNQGVPTQVPQQIAGGFAGLQPILDLQTNQQVQSIFANTPLVSRQALTNASQIPSLQSTIDTNQLGILETDLERLRQENQRLQQQVLKSQQEANIQSLTSLDFQNSTTLELPPTGNREAPPGNTRIVDGG